jgi:hypothetical protein
MENQPSQPVRWAGAGHSSDADAPRAARAAVAAALDGREPALLVLFAGARHDAGALAAAARAEAGEVPLIGCSGADADEVTAFALGGPGFSVAAAAADEADLRESGVAAARCLERVEALPHRALLMLADGRAGDPQEVVRGAYSVAGPGIPLVGGCADGGRGSSWLAHDGRRHDGPVVAAALASEAPLGVGVRHGWRPAGEPLLVTEAEGTLLRRLNDAPALDAYLDAVGEEGDFDGLARRHPLGAPAARGREPLVRAIAAADPEARTLELFGELPTGTLVTPMAAEEDALRAAADAACSDALAALGGRPPLGLLTFAGDARRATVGPHGDRDRLVAVARSAAVAGFHGCGEIARTRGLTGFHNGALAVLAIA